MLCWRRAVATVTDPAIDGVIAPAAKRMVGNFPQAFSHVGLINTAHNLTGGGPAGRRHDT